MSKQCSICFFNFNDQEYNMHYLHCLNEQQNMMNSITNKQINYNVGEQKDNEINKVIQLSKLTPSQEKAVATFKKKSKIISKGMKLLTLARFEELGYSEKDFENSIKFIKYESQIVIHVNLEKTLNFLLKDTHYRNQFETKTSSGALSTFARMDWERNLFGKVYDSVSGFERVKYGALNMTNDSCGVKCAYLYGDSYFVMKKEVKERTSFTYGDSAAKEMHMCSFDDCIQMLYYIDEYLLKNLIKLATDKINKVEPHMGIYIEIQIHGPVELNDDIALLVVNDRHKNTPIMESVHKFCEKNKIQFKFISELK